MLRGLLLLIIVGFIALAFYLGWFNVSAGGDSQRGTVQLTVDKGKMERDTGGLRSGAQQLARTARERAGQQPQNSEVTGTVRDVDTDGHHLTIGTAEGKVMTFDITSNSVIKLNQQSDRLGSLQPGDRVAVHWRQTGTQPEALAVGASR